MSMASDLLPPAQPAFILRGHSAQIHAVHFTKDNARLLTADGDGWIVSWNLAFKRPVAVWRAHSTAILGVGSWGYDRIITHGRDHKLIVWKVNEEDEAALDKTLPVDANDVPHRNPWLLHALSVNTLNFCPFAMCRDGMPQIISTQKAIKDNKLPEPILVAVPNTIDSGGIDIYQLPTQVRAANINADRSVTTGMVMALAILAESTRIQVAAGYESGHTMVFIQNDPAAAFQRLYSAKPHTEPVLSLTLSPLPSTTYLTTSADANISRHPFPTAKSIWNTEMKPIKTVPTKHSGQQGCSYRNDGKVFATAGWDGAGRVYSGKTMKEVAVLKWGSGVGCYATAFAAVSPRCGGKVNGTKEGDEEEAAVEASTSTLTSWTSSPTSASPSTTTSTSNEIAPSPTPTITQTSIQQRRDEKARTTHWLAIGAKDGKVSLWDIY